MQSSSEISYGCCMLFISPFIYYRFTPFHKMYFVYYLFSRSNMNLLHRQHLLVHKNAQRYRKSHGEGGWFYSSDLIWEPCLQGNIRELLLWNMRFVFCWIMHNNFCGLTVIPKVTKVLLQPIYSHRIISPEGTGN